MTRLPHHPAMRQGGAAGDQNYFAMHLATIRPGFGRKCYLTS